MRNLHFSRLLIMKNFFKKTTKITKPKGVDQVEGKSISKAITKRGVEVGELIQNKMQRNGKDSEVEQIKFISIQFEFNIK